MKVQLFLEEQATQKVHEAALSVLERTGVLCDSEEATDLYLSGGAKRDNGRILIPASLSQKALEQCQKQIQLFSRLGDNPIVLDDSGATYFGPGSDALYNVDREEYVLRESTLDDIRENVRIADALSAFSFVMSMGLPHSHVPAQRLYSTVFAEMVQNTTKPLVVTSTTIEDIRQIHKIACIVRESEEELRRKPFFVAYLEPVSPLKLFKNITDRVLFCAEKGIPIVFAAGANLGSGAPITPLGGVVQGTAESLAGLTLAFLKNEEVSFIFGANTSSMDMSTSIVSYGAPEWFKTVSMYAEMGTHYKMASWGTAGCSDSFGVDPQSAMEAYEGIMMAVLSGVTLAHDVGYLAHGEVYDARMLILTDEMIKRARHLFKPVNLSADELAVDVIDEVARQNELYLAHSHTATYFRQSLWLPPTYINRKHVMEYSGSRQLAEQLGDQVQQLLQNHEPQPLEDEKWEKIEALLSSL